MGARVLYFKRTPLTQEEEAQYGGISYAPLERLLAESDFVSLHLPYHKQTEHFAGRDFFAAMKAGAYLINSARGGIVDEQALYHSLRNGHLAGAALDVYRYEPVPADCPLLELDNILWTPHICGGAPEYMIAEAEAVLTNIARVVHGKPPDNLVPELQRRA
jgi:lactate dehydrogenase-like 2-hydroxyacid dehydrogenase